MKRQILFFLSFSLLPILLLSSKAKATEHIITLHPVADTYVYEGDSLRNYGGASSLEVGNTSITEYQKVAFVKFDISSIPANATITDARFRNYLNNCVGTMDKNNIYTGQVTSDWKENVVSWKTMPTYSVGSSRTATCDSVIWWGFNVKDIVTNWHNGQHNYGLVLYTNAHNSHLRSFNSRQAGSVTNQPELGISYTLPDPVVTPEEPSGTGGTTTPSNPSTGNTPSTPPDDPGTSTDPGTNTQPGNPDTSANPAEDTPLIQDTSTDDTWTSPIFGSFGMSFCQCCPLLCCCLLLVLLLIFAFSLVKRKKEEAKTEAVQEASAPTVPTAVTAPTDANK